MIARRRYHRAGVQGMQQSLPSIFALGATERAGAPAHGKDALAARCTARAAEAGRLRRAALALRSAAASCPPRTGCPKRARQNRHQHKPHGRRPPLTPLTRPHVRAAPACLLVPGGVGAVGVGEAACGHHKQGPWAPAKRCAELLWPSRTPFTAISRGQSPEIGRPPPSGGGEEASFFFSFRYFRVVCSTVLVERSWSRPFCAE